MLNHIVMFALEGFTDQEHRQRHLALIKTELEGLLHTIPALRGMNVAINENPQESYDLILISQVDSLDTLSEYAQHPEHVRIATELIRPYLKARACVDYTA